MAIFRCKMCGGDLEIIENASSCTCDFCGTQQTIPTVKDENLQGLFNRANVLRMKSEFDKAEEIYEKILQSSSTEAEAYWGLILCKYGIEYVEDPATYKRVPTCHRASYDAITADVDYKNALQYADVQQKLIYEAEAKEIEEVQKGIMALVANEEPYDVFICYKETDESGKRTQDSVIANDIYYQLTQEGFKVFYAAITLEDKLGTEYEPYIFSALNTAKVMLSLGTKPEYFNAVWVKNEWSRFLKIMKKDRSKMLIPCYRDMDAYELPEEFAHLQAQDMSKIGFINDIVRGIKKVVVKENVASQVVQQTVIQQAAPVNSNIQALLDRGNMAIEDSEWEKADGFFEEVLNQDAKSAQAYLGKLLAREHKGSWDAYIRSQCNKYSDADYESLEACPENIDAINDAVSKYVIENYVKESEIRDLFKYDRTYFSQLSERERQKKAQLSEMAEDKLLNRIKQYMSGELEERISTGLSKIETTLENRISQARNDDENSVNRVKAAYRTSVDSAVEAVKDIYHKACEARENDYQISIAKLDSVESISQILDLKSDFMRIGDYKDSLHSIEVCEQKRAALESAKEKAEAERKHEADLKEIKEKKFAIVSIASVIGLFVVFIIIVKVIIPDIKYREAEKLYVNDNVLDAYLLYSKVGNAKSIDRMNEIREKKPNVVVAAADIGEEISYGENEWTVLDKNEDTVLLYSKYLIQDMGYGTESWGDSKIREWLNGEFLNTFSNSEKEYIKEVKLKDTISEIIDEYRNEVVSQGVEDLVWIYADDINDITTNEEIIDDLDFNRDYINNSLYDETDRVYLLSTIELHKYLKKPQDRIAFYENGQDSEFGGYWLQGGFKEDNWFPAVGSDGLYNGGMCNCRFGIRPAIRVSISNL